MTRAYNVVDGDDRILEPLNLWDDYHGPKSWAAPSPKAGLWHSKISRPQQMAMLHRLQSFTGLPMNDRNGR